MGERGMLPGDPRAKDAGAKGGKSVVPDPSGNPLFLGEVPPVPSRLTPRTRDLWEALWTSTLAGALDWKVDRGILERWAYLHDAWFKAFDELARSDTVIAGSQGQDVLHPLSTEVSRIEGMLSKIEKELGLTPMSRARLGLTQLEGQLTAAQLNEMVREQTVSEGFVDITVYEEGPDEIEDATIKEDDS